MPSRDTCNMSFEQKCSLKVQKDHANLLAETKTKIIKIAVTYLRQTRLLMHVKQDMKKPAIARKLKCMKKTQQNAHLSIEAIMLLL